MTRSETSITDEGLVHPEAPEKASLGGRVKSADTIRARYRNGVILLHTGWASGRGRDRDTIWVARLGTEVVGVWHANPVMVQECWTIGSTSTKEATLIRFADWRRAVRSLSFNTP